MRNGEVSYWWQARGIPARPPSLPGSTEADVCIVGAGYTGLWTAYYLNRADPALRIVVLEASFAGFGASGRNGGWVTAELPGSRARYARGPHGIAGVRGLEAALRDTVDEGGRVAVATSPSQLARLRDTLNHLRTRGDGEDIYAFLGRDELAGRITIAG